MWYESDGVVGTADKLPMIVETEGIAEGIIGVAAYVHRTTDVSRCVTSVDCEADVSSIYRAWGKSIRPIAGEGCACSLLQVNALQHTVSHLANHVGSHDLRRPFHVRHLDGSPS